ncbi:MAG: type II toxin-antitoxin system VapC family toxin [Proteobacteria bacterium]|nr:type II toxin-antitoxin system VapC family toxin [Pseudomonadota bacterium]
MLYVDTSALIAYFIPEVHSAKVEAVLMDASRYPLAISEWTATEFVSALGIKCRTGQLTEAQSIAVQEQYEAMKGHFMLLTVETADFHKSAEWLRNWRLGLRSGDALHLSVAERHGLTVCTLDRGMTAAALALGLPCETL